MLMGSGHWGRALGILPRIHPVCLPPSSTLQAASLMIISFCFSGHLLPTGAAGSQDKGPAGPGTTLCLCLEQVEAWPAAALREEIKAIDRQAHGPLGSRGRCM